jgi:Ribbon-helix-helix protein, copG family
VRTTLTLDDDVAARLQTEARRTGRSFKEVVNHYLRLGFVRGGEKPKRFKVHARNLGALRPGLSLDNIAELTDLVEGARHR